MLSKTLAKHRLGRGSDEFSRMLNGSEFLPCAVHAVRVLRGHRGCINTCSFNPLGDLELTGCDDGCVWLWDIGNQMEKPKMMLSPHVTNVFTTNFLSGNRFMSGGNDATVQVAEVGNDGRVISTVYDGHHVAKVMCSFVVDENTFATCSYDRTVRLFDIRTQYRNQKSVELPILTENDFNYNGQRKLAEDLMRFNLRSQAEGGGHCSPRTDPVDDTSLLLDFRGHESCELFTMDIHPIDRKRFITSGNDGTVRLFDLRSIRSGVIADKGFSVNCHYKRNMNVTGAAYDDRGERIAATVIGGNIHVLDADQFIDLSTIAPLQEPQRPRGRDIDITELMNDHGEFDISRLQAVLAGLHEEVMEDEEEEAPGERIAGEMMELTGHTSRQTIKTCNWYGDFVVTGSDEGSVFFYDPKDGHIVNIVNSHEGNVNVVTVHKEKKLLATSGIDDYSVLWAPMSIASQSLAQTRKHVSEYMEVDQSQPQYGCSVQ